ncbi:hypothetical protein [Enterococcus faecalis]|uniref:hypothetical protein n=1 Tax=Enterococcus faecalis TaxID=1351 RepID=UPI001F02B754|nr:hypothetical protein [Enterococcus faecalis]
MNKKLKQRIIVLIGLILTGVGFGNNQAITDFLTLPIKESIQKVTTPSEKKKVQSNEQTRGTWNIETKMHGRKANNCR